MPTTISTTTSPTAPPPLEQPASKAPAARTRRIPATPPTGGSAGQPVPSRTFDSTTCPVSAPTAVTGRAVRPTGGTAAASAAWEALARLRPVPQVAALLTAAGVPDASAWLAGQTTLTRFAAGPDHPLLDPAEVLALLVADAAPEMAA